MGQNGSTDGKANAAPAAAGAGGGAGTGAAAAAAAPAKGDASGETVFVNVYDSVQQQPNIPGFGVYHSGVEIYGTEYVYAGGGNPNWTGVSTQKVKWQPAGSPWKYRESVAVGTTKLTKTEVQALVKTIGGEFLAGQYHLTDRNCNHFSEALVKGLGLEKAFPAWINRAAKTGGALASMVGVDAMKFAQQAAGDADMPKGQPLEAVKAMEIVDLSTQLDLKTVSCLNQSDKHSVANVLEKSNSKFLESDCDEQLLLFVPFKKIVKLHALSFSVYYPDSPNAKFNPLKIKLFANARNLDFTDAPNQVPTATIPVKDVITAELKAHAAAGATKKPGDDDALLLTILLPIAKFQVNTFIMFVESNFGAPTTRLRHLSLKGQP